MTNQERIRLAKKFNDEKQSAAIDERQRQRLEFVNRMHQNKPSQVAIQPYNIKAVPADKTDLQPNKAEKQPEDNPKFSYSVNMSNVLDRLKQGQDTRLMQEYLAQGKKELDNAYYKKRIQELKANLSQQRSKYSDPVLAGNNIRSQVQATAYAQHKAEQERLKQLEKEYESYQYTNAPRLEKQFTEKLEKIAGQLSKPIDEGARAALEELQAQTKKEYDAFHGSEAAKTYRYDQKTAKAKELLNTDEDVKKRIQFSYEVARGNYGIKDENGKEVSYNSFAAKQNKGYYYPLFEKKKQEAEASKQWLSDKGYDVEALLDVYSSEQNAQQRKKVEKMQKDLARENPALATAASWATNTLGALGAPEIGMHEPIKNTIKELQTGELHPVDSNSPYYNAIHATDTLREMVSEDMNGFERLLYQYGMSLADSLTTIPLDDFGLALMGNSSASRAALNVAENGGSATQALWTGAAAGAAEVLFEKVSLDQLKAFKKSNKTGLKESIKNIAKGMFTEGSEEAATDVANLVSDALINADNSDFSRAVQAYEEQGLSEEEAWKRAALDTVSNIGLDFVGGALSGAVLSAGATALNAADTAHFGSDIKKGRSDYSLEDLTEIGKTTNPQSRAYQLADKLIKRQEQGKRIGNYQAGALFRENLLNHGNFDHALRGISLKEVQSDLLDQGLQSGDDTQAYQLASLMKEKQEQGQAVTNRERVALEQAIDEAGAQDTALRKKLEADPAAFSAYLAKYKNTPKNGAEAKNTAQGETTLPMPETAVSGAQNARGKLKTKNAAGTLSTTVGYDKKLQHIQEIAGTEDGRVKVTLSTGKTVDLDRVAVASEETRAVYSMAANFDKAGANAFVDHYKGNLPKEYYADGFQAFYLAGRQGRGLEVFSKRFPQTVSVMGQESVAAAYQAGVNDQAALLQKRQENAARFKTEGASRIGLFQVDADRKKLTGDMKAQLQILQGLSDHYGVNIRVVDSKSSEGGDFPKQANGIYRGNGNIVVDINADAGAVAAVAFHEVGHYISEHNPEGFKVLSDFAVQYLEKQEGYDIDERVTALQKATREQTGRWISETDALEEIVCNSLSSIASDSGAINAALRLTAKKRRTLSQVLRDFAQRLKEIFSDYAQKNKEAARWKDSYEDIMEMARLLEESADTAKKTEMPQSGDIEKYTLKRTLDMSYEDQLKAFFNQDKGQLKNADTICVMEQSPILMKYGFEDSPVALLQSNLRKILREPANNKNKSSHNIPQSFIENLPEYIDQPAMVMLEQDRVTLFTNQFVENISSGSLEPVIVGLQVNKKADTYAVHEIKSIYGLRDIETYLRDKTAGGAEMFVEDRKKAEKLLSKAGLQLAGRQQILNLSSNIVNASQKNVKDSSYAENNGEKNRTDTWLKFTRLQLPANNNQYGPTDTISNPNDKSNNGTRKYFFNPEFVRQYDKWDKRAISRKRFEVGTTSLALQSIGVPDRKIYWDTSKIAKIREKHISMTDAVIKQVPSLLEHPVVVMQSNSVNSRITILGEVFDSAGKPVLAVLELEPMSNGNYLNELKIASAYEKDTPQNLINTSKILYVEPNKNRTHEWLSRTRLQLPFGLNHYGPINIISNSSSKSNTEIDRLKYSLRETAEFEGRPNEQEDQAVQEMNSLVARLFRETGKKQADIQALRRVGRKILKEYQSSYSLDTFVDNYQKIFDYMANSGQADYREAIRLCTGVAKAVLEKSETLDTSMRDQYADFMREMREERVSLSDVQKEELAYSYGSYRAGRNRLMGRVVVSDNGIPLDSLWGELCLKYPELFDYDTDEAQQVFRLIEVFDSLKPQMKNEFEGNIDEAAAELAYRLYEEYFSVPELKSETQKQNNRILALRAEFKKSLEEARQQYRQRYRQAQQELEKEYRTKNLELNREKQQAVIRAKAQAQAYYRKIYENTRTRNKESRERSEYKNKIERNAQDLFRWITKPNKRNHVPQPLVGPITEFILSLDFVSPRLNKDGTAALINSTNKIQKWSDAFYELNNVLQGLKSNEQNGMNTAFLLHLDPELPVRLSRFISEYRGSKTINQMNAVQLKELYWITSAVKSAVVSANELHNNRLFQHVEQLGDSTIEQTAGKKEKLLTNGVLKAADDFFGLSQMDSFSYFERLGPAAYSVLEELRDGFDKHVLNLNNAIEFFQKAKGDLDISSWTGNKARKYTFQVAGGKITLTTGHIMGLYEEVKRKQAAFHIFGGGIRTYAIKENGIKPVRVTLGDVQKITAVLTAEQKQFADQLQQYFARECTRQGNEASMTLYGYEKFSDPHYYPIQVDKNSVATIKNDQQTQLWSVLNMGFTKEVAEEASNPIILNDIFDVFTKHVTEMSVYNAFSVPILDAMKWFNYRNTKGFSVKQGVERVYGKSGQQYFLKLIEDISGTRNPDFENNLLNHAVKAYKLSAVGFNLRVAIQQPTAYIRAACVIDPKYLAAGLSKKPDIALTNRYVPISLWKSWGFYDVNVGNSMKSVLTGVSTAYEKMTEMSMWLPGKADDVTWSIIFNACCAEIKDSRPDLAVNSDAFYKAAGRRMRDVVDRTQVVDTVFHKSHFMRNTNIFAKTAGAFMSETNKSYNLIRNAILNAVEEKDGKAVRNLIRVASVLLLTNFVTGLAQSIMDAFRDDDKDKKWAEKYIENILPNFWNNSNPLGYLPVLKDISDVVTSLFTQEAYYQNNSDMSTAAIIALIQSIKNWIKHSNGEGDKNIYALISESVKAISKFGIPAGNILRELESFYAVVVPGGVIKSETDLMYRDMYRAVAEGDKERYAEIYNELLDKKGKSKKQIENGLADFLSSNSKEIDEAANHLASGEKDAYRKIVMDMKALGFKQDTVVMAVNKRMVKLQRAQREQSFLPPAQYGIYGADEKISSANEYDLLFDALINNTQEEYNQLYSVLLQGNKTASQIKSALSTRKEKLLRQYAAALKSGDSNKIEQLEKQMVKAFGSKSAADAAVKRYMEKIYQ